jgi:hypothetical protein
MLFITDKDDNNYVWTKDELDEKYKEQLGLDAKYVSGSNGFGNNGIMFSVYTINGEAYFISKEGEVKKASEIKISYVPKNEIKTKKIHNLTIE